MTETPDLQGEEATPGIEPNRKKLVLLLIPAVLVMGVIAIWVTWPTSNEVAEELKEREDLPAAKPPPIVPQVSERTIDVPSTIDAPSTEESPDNDPLYIPPAVEDIPVYSDTLELPAVNPFALTPHDERRSRLQHALNASPIVKVVPVDMEDEGEPQSATNDSVETHDESHALTPGAVIPSVLLQGINTDLPGIAVAQVSRDVYDSRTGTKLLIPRGSRIFGTYGSELQLSDQRVLVSWERIDLPNGKTITLESVVGADQSGNAGLQDQVHRRTRQALAVTGLTSLITSGLTHAANSDDPTALQETLEGRFVQEPSYAGEATREISQQYGNIVGQIAQRYLDQGPTRTIRPGYEFTIQLMAEVRLSPYRQ